MAFFRDDRAFARARLSSPAPRAIAPGADAQLEKLARTYNRIGGLLETFAARTGIPVKAALAVWTVESGGREFQRGKPVLRFEVHKFWGHWGETHAEAFDAHFQFGGRAGIADKPWRSHRFRPSTDADWTGFHGDQSKEYAVFDFACALGGREAACLSSSFGGPQILGSNHAIVGHASATSLFESFASSERWHVCGFFDYCRSHNLIDAIKVQDWLTFARAYNGEGQAADYARLIAEAYALAEEVEIAAKG
jgi:N-acetylmuramidase